MFIHKRGVIRYLKERTKKIPIIGDLARQTYRKITKKGSSPKPFTGSAQYWEERYITGGNSGVGSYAKFAQFKAEVINNFVVRHNVESVIEFGCGDGNQLKLAEFRKYFGFDISPTAISLCKKLFSSDINKQFKLTSAYSYSGEKADLALSLDVLYHLVEDEVFVSYMKTLFGAANRYVIIYSSDSDDTTIHEAMHVRHRKFTKWIQENISGWKMIAHIPNRYPFRGDYRMGSFADFFIYENLAMVG